MLERLYKAFHCWSRHFLAAAPFLLAFVLSTPQHAVASCGDYVMVDGHPAANASPKMDLEHSSPRQKLPICHGPQCSQNREIPSSPPTRMTLDEQSWGLPAQLVDLASKRILFLGTATESVEAFSVVSDIFRPPRFMVAV